eukprot:scaffold9679_cov92-Cylindrotheca_fusiformis.AAC.1
MGCTTSKESVAEANLRAINRNLKNGRDRMGHDKDTIYQTPGLETYTSKGSGGYTGFLASAGCGGF